MVGASQASGEEKRARAEARAREGIWWCSASRKKRVALRCGKKRKHKRRKVTYIEVLGHSPHRGVCLFHICVRDHAEIVAHDLAQLFPPSSGLAIAYNSV
eukprot:3327364-Rhodomonas_salina.1